MLLLQLSGSQTVSPSASSAFPCHWTSCAVAFDLVKPASTEQSEANRGFHTFEPLNCAAPATEGGIPVCRFQNASTARLCLDYRATVCRGLQIQLCIVQNHLNKRLQGLTALRKLDGLRWTSPWQCILHSLQDLQSELPQVIPRLSKRTMTV